MYTGAISHVDSMMKIKVTKYLYMISPQINYSPAFDNACTNQTNPFYHKIMIRTVLNVIF